MAEADLFVHDVDAPVARPLLAGGSPAPSARLACSGAGEEADARGVPHGADVRHVHRPVEVNEDALAARFCDFGAAVRAGVLDVAAAVEQPKACARRRRFAEIPDPGIEAGNFAVGESWEGDCERSVFSQGEGPANFSQGVKKIPVVHFAVPSHKALSNSRLTSIFVF